jgi:hypothetical protein
MARTTEELVKKYPKIFQDYEGNPGRVNWSGVPQGWIPIIDVLCGSIQDYIDHTSTWNKELSMFASPPQVTCVQVKEKFGGLRFYTNGHDDIVEGMITMAEYMCSQVCEDCGSKEDLGITSGWIRTLCRSCVILHGDRAMNSWKSKKETE